MDEQGEMKMLSTISKPADPQDQQVPESGLQVSQYETITMDVLLDPNDPRSPYRYALHQVLHARLSARNALFETNREFFDNELEWELRRQEINFADTFGFMPPRSIFDLYQMIVETRD